MLPGIAYYLSRWYRRSELALRLALYIVMAPLAGAFGGLLASGILTLDHFGSLHSWRMIFAIEGIITIGLALIAFFTLTDRPATAKWLSQEEKDLAEARVKSERVCSSNEPLAGAMLTLLKVSTTEVLDRIDTRKVLQGIFCPVVMATAFQFLLNNITVQGLAFFAPTIVATIYPEASVVSLQLHTVPPYVVGAFFTVLFPLLSTIYDRRLVIMMISAVSMRKGRRTLKL
jgi:MFS family permease